MLSPDPREAHAPSANALVSIAALALSGFAALALRQLGVDAAAAISGSLLTGLSVLILGGWASACWTRSVENRTAKHRA